MPDRAAAEPLAYEEEHPTTGEVTNSPLTVQRAILPEAPPAVEWSASPARSAGVAEAPPLAVQRQAEDAAPATADDPASPAAGEASEVDVDELARRVYSEVKRRLALEWERARGRLG